MKRDTMAHSIPEMKRFKRKRETFLVLKLTLMLTLTCIQNNKKKTKPQRNK